MTGNVFRGDQGNVTAKQFAVIVSRYNESITGKLLEGALETLRQHQVDENGIHVYHVPGAWEIPLMAQHVLPNVDAVVCLGAVIRGDTTHDVHINTTVSSLLGQLAIDSGKPVSFGVLTCNNLEQAIQRSGGSVGNKGHEATEAAIEMLRLLDASPATRG